MATEKIPKMFAADIDLGGAIVHLQVEGEEDAIVPVIENPRKEPRRRTPKTQLKKVKVTSAGRMSHAGCNHARSGEAGKVARAKCRARRQQARTTKAA